MEKVKIYKIKLRITNNEKLFFLFLNKNLYCGNSKEPSQCDGSFEHQIEMVLFSTKTHVSIDGLENNFNFRLKKFAHLFRTLVKSV